MKLKDIAIILVILWLVYQLTKPIERHNNEAHIQSMDPAIRSTVRDFFKDIEALGYTPKIRDSVRTYEQQAYYKKLDKRNAAPGHSSHETGFAIDLDIYKNGKVLSKRTPRSFWVTSGIPKLAKEYGIIWGGNYKGYADNNHFDFSKI